VRGSPFARSDEGEEGKREGKRGVGKMQKMGKDDRCKSGAE
jgi:hypothetical protein